MYKVSDVEVIPIGADIELLIKIDLEMQEVGLQLPSALT